MSQMVRLFIDLTISYQASIVDDAAVFYNSMIMEVQRRYKPNYDWSLVLKNIAEMCSVDKCEFYKQSFCIKTNLNNTVYYQLSIGVDADLCLIKQINHPNVETDPKP